jgi:hypothetical protein
MLLVFHPLIATPFPLSSLRTAHPPTDPRPLTLFIVTRHHQWACLFIGLPPRHRLFVPFERLGPHDPSPTGPL